VIPVVCGRVGFKNNHNRMASTASWRTELREQSAWMRQSVIGNAEQNRNVDFGNVYIHEEMNPAILYGNSNLNFKAPQRRLLRTRPKSTNGHSDLYSTMSKHPNFIIRLPLSVSLL
jgi:hypothetical protein